MSHGLTEYDQMFTVRVPAWHRHPNAKVLSEYPGSLDDARREAGLDWEPEERVVYLGTPWSVPGQARLAATFAPSGQLPSPVVTVDGSAAATRFVPIKGQRALVRSDNDHVLSVQSDTYGVISNGTLFEIVEALLEQPRIKVDAAGSTEGGRKVWITARLDEPVEVPGLTGDRNLMYPFLSVVNSHDGSTACKAVASNFVVVCANTFRATDLLGARTGLEYTFRHTVKVSERVEEAKAAIRGARTDVQEFREIAESLSLIKVTPKMRAEFLAAFVPAPVADIVSDRVMTNVEQARAAIVSILSGPTCEGIEHTGLGLVSAAGEYLDHYRRYRSPDTYVNRTLLRPEPLKRRAMVLVKELASS